MLLGIEYLSLDFFLGIANRETKEYIALVVMPNFSVRSSTEYHSVMLESGALDAKYLSKCLALQYVFPLLKTLGIFCSFPTLT